MEKMKRRIRAILLCAVMAAIFVGLVYYYYSVKDGATVTEGTLITIVSNLQNAVGRVSSHGILS